MHWSDISDDPTNDDVLQRRAATIDRAWTMDERERAAIIIDACRGLRVVDVGCVDHLPDSFARSSWLHRQISEVASECIGVDSNADGVEAMQAQGFEVVVADISEAAASVGVKPFDVVVAGEFIEHLGRPEDLFLFAAAVLRDDGELLITTPNPYALHRVRTGQLRLTWENVDHVSYLFPSGIAEFADRHGFLLTAIATVHLEPFPVALRNSMKALLKAMALRAAGGKGSRGRLGLPLPTLFVSPLDLLLHRVVRGSEALGETSIYRLRWTGTPHP